MVEEIPLTAAGKADKKVLQVHGQMAREAT